MKCAIQINLTLTLTFDFEPASLAGDDSVQRVAGNVQYSQEFVHCSPLCHCHQRVQLCANQRAGPP